MDTNVSTQLEELKKLIQEQNLLKKEVLTSKETSVYLGLSLGYLYKLTGKSKIPAYKPNNGKLYYRRMDLNRWMLSKRRACLTAMSDSCELFINQPEKD